MHIGLNRVHRAFNDQLDSHRRGQVKDDIALVHEFRRNGLVLNVINGVVKARIVLQVANVFETAGGKIVDDKDFVAAF